MREIDPAWTWNGSPLPSAKPPYRLLWADSDGRIWIMLHTQSREDTTVARQRLGEEILPSWPRSRWREEQIFDIVEPTGRYLGKVRSPETIYPQVARGDRIWAMVLTDGGLRAVKRYRIVWSPPGRGDR
jgi:hypothetical protein